MNKAKMSLDIFMKFYFVFVELPRKTDTWSLTSPAFYSEFVLRIFIRQFKWILTAAAVLIRLTSHLHLFTRYIVFKVFKRNLCLFIISPNTIKHKYLPTAKYPVLFTGCDMHIKVILHDDCVNIAVNCLWQVCSYFHSAQTIMLWALLNKFVWSLFHKTACVLHCLCQKTTDFLQVWGRVCALKVIVFY